MHCSETHGVVQQRRDSFVFSYTTDVKVLKHTWHAPAVWRMSGIARHDEAGNDRVGSCVTNVRPLEAGGWMGIS